MSEREPTYSAEEAAFYEKVLWCLLNDPRGQKVAAVAGIERAGIAICMAVNDGLFIVEDDGPGRFKLTPTARGWAAAQLNFAARGTPQ